MPQPFRLLDLFSNLRTATTPAQNAKTSTPAGAQEKLDGDKVARLRQLTSSIPTDGEEVNSWNNECSTLIDALVTSRLPSAELARILSGLISYQKTGVTASQSHMAFINAFGNTSGLFQELLHQALHPRASGDEAGSITSPHFGVVNAEARVTILSELRANGYAVLPFMLSPSCVERLCDAASKLSFKPREVFVEDVTHIVSPVDPTNPPQCGALHAAPGQSLSDPDFSALANDPLIISLASDYLETPVSPIDAVMWYSFPAARASSELAQLFHYDLDTLRWLKAFYYLTDVTDVNGPHEYIEGSHLPGAKSQVLLDRGYARIEDDDMCRFQSGALRSVVGQAGTVILGDTRAFHKGQHVQAGYRLIYSPIYAASKIGYVHSA